MQDARIPEGVRRLIADRIDSIPELEALLLVSIRVRVYLPALRRVREFTHGPRRQSFLGTDFNYEDLGFDPVDAPHNELHGENTIRGQACYRVSSKPGPHSRYSKILRFVDKSTSAVADGVLRPGWKAVEGPGVSVRTNDRRLSDGDHDWNDIVALRHLDLDHVARGTLRHGAPRQCLRTSLTAGGRHMNGRPRGGASVDPRIRLAAERTLLAWIRTGLAMMGFGFVVARFALWLRAFAGPAPAEPSTGYHLSVWFGMALVLLGVVTNGVAPRATADTFASSMPATRIPTCIRCSGSESQPSWL